MKISIIIATYNSGKTLVQCLESIKKQTYSQIEVIIKDGNSTDNTLDIIDDYKSILDLKYISNPDNGVYDAWNTALKMSSGDWVTFLGSDDYLTSNDAIELAIPFILKAKSNNVHLIYGMNDIVNIRGEYCKTLGENWNISKPIMKDRMSIRHPGSFCSKWLLNELNGFDLSFKIVGDYDFTLRSMVLTDFYFYPFSIVTHRIGGLSINPRRSIDVIKETFLLRSKNNLKPNYYIDKLFLKRLTLYILSFVFTDEFIFKILNKKL